MIVTPASMADIFTAYDMMFQQGLGSVTPTWSRIAMAAPSSGTTTKMPWLKNIPGLRQWIGERQFHTLEASSYEFPKFEHEDSVSVPLREIESDQFGVYAPYMRMMGEAYAAFPDDKIWGALSLGFTTTGYDGVPLFSASHPVKASNGTINSISNYQSGAESAWYLMVSNRGMKPLIWSVRKEEGFKPLLPQELVDREKRMDYGCYVDAGVGYGFWQLIFASKAALTTENYAAARAAIMAFYGDEGRKLGLVPDLLICAASNEGAARKIVVNPTAANGATNEWAGTAQVLVSPWLT